MTSGARVPRVYLDAPLAIGRSIALDETKRHHLGTVLRLDEGAPVALFNGSGAEYAARVARVTRQKMVLTVKAIAHPKRESPLAVTLVQAVARGDRMDFAIAKAVELGVARIQPVFTARGQVKLAGERLTKKQVHWQSIAESAAEQSGRLIRPSVEAARDLPALLEQPDDAESARLMLTPGAVCGLGECRRHDRIILLVGPESGLSATEIETAANHGWTPLTLGPRILRTETAGLAALAVIGARWGDLGDS
jgi:16S rRNA (uracil1498-N3)-methyltransferase